MFSQAIINFWYNKTLLAYLLSPLSWIFQLITKLRFFWYRFIKKPVSFNTPIIIVGNISLGGTGKTPLVALLAAKLQERGYHPGIVMRGYGGALLSKVDKVNAQSLPSVVGDEAILLAKKTQVPVVVGHNRVAAVKHLLACHPQVDLILSDDGLQHYALARDIEIVVIDGARRLGNGFCLPVGPLRESSRRLHKVDFIVTNGRALKNEWEMGSNIENTVLNVTMPEQTKTLDDFVGKTVHAVAGIGHPDRFFALLEAKGLKLIKHFFADHHCFKQSDFNFSQDFPIVMTEKDAVKCRSFTLNNAWAVPLAVNVPAEFIEKLIRKITDGQKITRHPSLSNMQAARDL